MNQIIFKSLSIALLFIGEALCIYAEVIAAHSNSASSSSAIAVFLKSFGLIAISGAMLIGGYMVGIASFKNIWVVTVLSVTSILLLEPLLSYGIFQELPSKGALVGLILGALGLVAAMF